MRLSVFSIVDSYPEFEEGSRDRYRELLELASAAESAGASTLWVAEHHFHSGGVCPAPPVLLAAAGERTQRLRLGVMVSVLPFHPPVDTAEQYALLDRVLGGRLDLGVGSGYLAPEFEGFGVDPATKRERFDSALELMVSAFRGEPVRSSASAAPVRLNVRPIQSPHPPIWIAAQRREAVPYVARRRLNLALVPYATVPNLNELAGVIGDYRGASPPRFSGRVSAMLPVYAGPAPEEGRSAFQRFLDSRLATQSTFYREKVRSHPESATSAGLEAAGLAVLGSPEEARAGLARFAAAGVDEVLAVVDFGGLRPAAARATLEALGPG